MIPEETSPKLPSRFRQIPSSTLLSTMKLGEGERAASTDNSGRTRLPNVGTCLKVDSGQAFTTQPDRHDRRTPAMKTSFMAPPDVGKDLYKYRGLAEATLFLGQDHVPSDRRLS